MSNDQAMTPLRAKQVHEQDIVELSAAEIVLLQGDLSILTAAQRVDYYAKVCESVGLNPLTKPFDYIVLNARLTLYAKKDATDQLRGIHGISVTKLEREQTADSYDVVAYGRDRTGREDSALGSVPTTNLRGEALSNAKMKAETKAKRRLTLSLAGLGWLDETEVGAIPSAQPVSVTESGIIEPGPGPRQLSAIVQDRLSEPHGEPPSPAVAPTPAPAPSVAGEGNDGAPREQAQGQPAAADAPDMVAVAEGIFREELAEEPAVVASAPGEPGLDVNEFLRMIREHHILLAMANARALTQYGAARVVDLTDTQRYELYGLLIDDTTGE